MKLCALCDVEITEENDTNEHIIPNSIGGRQKVRGFICISCNRTSGDQWDAELAKQLNPLSLLFHIKKDRGGPPPSQTFETTSGEKITLHHHGRMSPSKAVFVKEERDGKSVIHIQARDMKEAKRMLEGVKGKHPSIQVEEILAGVAMEERYLDGMVEMSLTFGGTRAGRSVVKTALALASWAGIEARACEHAMGYLRLDGPACFGYYYAKDLLIDRPFATPLHCVAISGSPETGLLLGYLEYFGLQKVVLCLSENYSGPSVECCYAIDPRTGEELNINVRLSLTMKDILAAYDYETYDYAEVIKCFEAVMPAALEAKAKRERDQVIADAIEYGFEKCGAAEGEILTQEHLEKLVEAAMEKIKPLILRS